MSHIENETQSRRHQTNLPAALTSFIGREQEVADIIDLLASSRLVTLTGAAGCGKTRHALRVGADVAEHFPHGIYWVELARLTDPALVPQTVAKVLRVPEERGRPLIQSLLDALHERQLLLILDNCEHLLVVCAQLVERLLPATEVSILATSREALGVAVETLYPISPMSLPPSATTPDKMRQFDAIQLFVERARAVLPAFDLTVDNMETIGYICQKLDGIPLALELASAQVNVLTVDQIAVRLDDRFELLSTISHVTHSPHDTLRAAIDWSYKLLAPLEQDLLRRLAVFVGGCSLTTVEAVCVGNGIKREQVLDLLSSLVKKSLVVAYTLQRSEARYTLLETVRQYAQDKLAAAGEWLGLQDRHLQCFLQLAEETRPKLTGQYQQLWLGWVEDEYDNLRSALSWSLESGDIEAGLRIAIAIYEFWTIRDYTEEALARVDLLLAAADANVSPLVRANALAYATFLAGFRGNSAMQAKYGREAAELAEVLGDDGQSALAWTRAGEAYAHGRPGPLPSGKSALAWALGAQAYSARAEGDYETEFATYKRVIQLYREAGERYFMGIALTTCAFAAMSLGKYEEARAMADEGLPLIRESGNPYRIAMTLNGSGDLARCERNYTRAQPYYEESIVLLREIGAVRDLASSLHNLGHTCLHLGDIERAHELFSESIALQQAQQNTPGVAECLMGFAAMAVVCGLPAAGARLMAVAIAIGGERVATIWPATRMEYEHYLALIRASLTESEFQTEQVVGRALSLEQAVEYAQHVALQTAAAHKAQKQPNELTAREREVVALIAQGRSNGEIADELVLSKRTVEKHISNILSKLHFTNRAQIVRWAIESGLANSSE